MNKHIICALALVSAGLANAGAWKGLDDASYYSGPKVTEADLAGKVVMIDEWGVNCPPCKALLPQMQKYWESFKSKPFVLIGSHRQGQAPEKVKELVEANKLTYPIYERAGLSDGEPDNGRAIPFIYVVNHRGKVVYSGRSDREAIAAAQDAILMVGQPPTLTPGIVFGKKSPYKAYEKNLVLGKPIAQIVKHLTADVKKADSKASTPALRAKAEEAKAILAAIETAKSDIKTDIENAKPANPAEALKLAKAYTVTFPEEGAAYKAELPELKARAAEAAKKK